MVNNRLRAAAALIPALFCALWIACPASAQKNRKPVVNSGATVVATVNGEKITRAEVWEDMLSNQIKRLDASYKPVVDMQRLPAYQFGTLIYIGKLAIGKMANSGTVTLTEKEIMDYVFKQKPQIVVESVQNIIREKAVAQAAKKAGIKVVPADLKKREDEMIAGWRQQYPDAVKGKSNDQVYGVLGVAPNTLHRYVRYSLEVEALVRKDMQKKNGHPFGPSDVIDASNVLVLVRPTSSSPPAGANAAPQPPSAADTEKAFADGKAKIEKLAADIKSGAKTFEKTASEVNEDNTRLREGKLGIFVRGQMVPEFEKVAFSLPKGKISDPVRTQFGWHLIRVDRTGAEITGPERAQAITAFVRSRASAKVNDIIGAAKITNTVPPPPAAPEMPGANGE